MGKVARYKEKCTSQDSASKGCLTCHYQKSLTKIQRRSLKLAIGAIIYYWIYAAISSYNIIQS